MRLWSYRPRPAPANAGCTDAANLDNTPMHRRHTVVAALLVCAAPAVAQLHEPDVPRDPSVLRAATDALAADWRHCRNEQGYPLDIGYGGFKIETLLSITASGPKKTGLQLTVTPHPETATRPLPPKPAIARFVSCVQRRFRKHRFHNPDAALVGTRIVISNPNYGGPLVHPTGGKLLPGPASEYVGHHLARLDRVCGLRRGKPWQVSVSVDADGRASAASATPERATVPTGADVRKARCVERRLRVLLHFPSARHATILTVVGGPS